MMETDCQLTDFQILLLLFMPGMGRKTLFKVMQLISFSPSSIKELHEALIASEKEISRFTVPDLETMKNAENRANNILSIASKNDIRLLCPAHPSFPKSLRTIPDPPILVYTRGNLGPLNNKTCIAVIGTRKPSKYGLLWAERLGAYLAKKDFGVISGLALGCDAAGHQGCLNENGYTLAVLANGLDKIYPASNRPLGEKILESGGCLLSEYPPGITPRKNFFVERDRLQSGLSAGVIIVETDLKGGTMHTANFALNQGKKLACLKHPEKYANNSKTLGNASLVSEGKATPISSKEDLLSFLSSINDKKDHEYSVAKNSVSSDKSIQEVQQNIKPYEQIPLFRE